MRSFRLFLLVSVIVLIAGIGAGECRAQGYSADEYKKDIRAALEAEDYTKAIVICENALRDYTNDADFFYYEGFALAESGQFDKAMETFKTADKIKPFKVESIEFKNKNARDQFDLGKYNRSSNYDLATKYFLESNRIEPENPMGLYEAAMSYSRKGENSNALKYFKEAIEIKPDFVALLALGTIYYENREWEEAHFYSKLTLELLPDYSNRNIIEERIKECEKHLGK
jgi:tetratricopeptide (TPR) repeat protein